MAQARYYLDNTTLVAPEDGHIINLQVRPGMVAGDYRIGAIASFICDDGRYLLAAYFQEILKYMTNGQPVEVALDLYPGQIFRGKVQSIWKASGEGQYLPSGNLPVFHPEPPKIPQGCFAVAIVFDDPDQSKFPIGAQGVAAVYTEGMKGPWAALRRVSHPDHLVDELALSHAVLMKLSVTSPFHSCADTSLAAGQTRAEIQVLSEPCKRECVVLCLLAAVLSGCALSTPPTHSQVLCQRAAAKAPPFRARWSSTATPTPSRTTG